MELPRQKSQQKSQQHNKDKIIDNADIWHDEFIDEAGNKEDEFGEKVIKEKGKNSGTKKKKEIYHYTQEDNRIILITAKRNTTTILSNYDIKILSKNLNKPKRSIEHRWKLLKNLPPDQQDIILETKYVE